MCPPGTWRESKQLIAHNPGRFTSLEVNSGLSGSNTNLQSQKTVYRVQDFEFLLQISAL